MSLDLPYLGGGDRAEQVLAEWRRATPDVVRRLGAAEQDPPSWTVVSTSGDVYHMSWAGDAPFLVRGALSDQLSEDLKLAARSEVWLPRSAE